MQGGPPAVVWSGFVDSEIDKFLIQFRQFPIFDTPDGKADQICLRLLAAK